MRTVRPAFTLIELLVVIAIIAIAMGMIGVVMSRTNTDAAVKASADALAGVLQEARTLAMANRAPYAVVFNIQNAPGSTGRVLNNRSGGHWYRILGPAKRGYSGYPGRQLLIPYPWSDLTQWAWYTRNMYCFPLFVEGIRNDWVGKPYALPARKVRFLALGETDEGNRIQCDWPDKGYGYTSTYPRPYFGYFDTQKGRLFPWGGYDPDLQASEPWKRLSGGKDPVSNYTGFFYQGSDGTVTGCVNPKDRVYKVDWNGDRDFADEDPVHGSEQSYYVYRKDEPRPLVNAEWLDSMIVFMPNGDAYQPPFGVARKRYSAEQTIEAPQQNPAPEPHEIHASGVSDRTKPWVDRTVEDYATGYSFWKTDGPRYFKPNYEVGDFSPSIRGWHITLAADSLDDRDAYPNAQAALKAIGPMYRVFVSRRGAIEVFRVRTVDDAWLEGKDYFPSSPDKLNDVDVLSQNFRYGWLHLPKTSTGEDMSVWTEPEQLVPTGSPISRLVCPRMLTDKIWWLK